MFPNIRHDVELEDDENAQVMSHHDDMQHVRHETHNVMYRDGDMYYVLPVAVGAPHSELLVIAPLAVGPPLVAHVLAVQQHRARRALR